MHGVQVCVVYQLSDADFAMRRKVLDAMMLSPRWWGYEEEWAKRQIPYNLQERGMDRCNIVDAERGQQLPEVLWVLVRARNSPCSSGGVNTSWYADSAYISKEKAEEEVEKLDSEPKRKETANCWAVPVRYWRR
jgi:hypothetical protein